MRYDVGGKLREARASREVIVSTGPPADLDIGLVVGSGESSIDDAGLSEASRLATVEAVDRMSTAAMELGATAVHGVNVTLVTKQGIVAAVAYGTAVA